MTTSIRTTIDELMAQLQKKEEELQTLKRTINMLCIQVQEPERFPDLGNLERSGPGSIRSDQFYRKSPTVAAREYLELRSTAVPAEEIVDAMERGGFDFEAQGWSKTGRVRNLSIAMSKNSLIFHRLPSGTYGLVKFYPEVEAEKRSKKSAGSSAEESGEEAIEEASPENSEPEGHEG